MWECYTLPMSKMSGTPLWPQIMMIRTIHDAYHPLQRHILKFHLTHDTFKHIYDNEIRAIYG